MPETRTVQILSTFLTGYPSTFDLYQPGTVMAGEMPIGYRWAGKITQLQVFTDSRAINAISLVLEDENGDEFEILENVRISRSTNPLNLIPLLGYPDGLQLSADTVLKAKIIYPQNIQAGNFITLMGFSEETGVGEIPGLSVLGVGSGGTGRSSLTDGALLVGNGTGAIDLLAPGADGEVLVSSGGQWALGAVSGGPGGAVDWADVTNKPTLFSGAYADLTGKPALFSGAYADLAGKPLLAAVAITGAYADLTGKPGLFSGAYADLTGKPTLFSGAYADLTGKPALFSGAYADLTGAPTLATVATTGAYADLTGKPTSPTVPTKSQTPPSSPVAGQEWHQTDADGNLIERWTWNAAHAEWLGDIRIYPVIYQSNSSAITTSQTASFGTSPFPDSRWLLKSLHYNFNFAGPQDASNYWTFRVLRRLGATSTDLVAAQSTASGQAVGSVVVNQKLIPSQLNQLSFIATRVGTAGEFTAPRVTLECQKIYG